MYNLVQIFKIQIDEYVTLCLYPPRSLTQHLAQRHWQMPFCLAWYNSFGSLCPKPTYMHHVPFRWRFILSRSTLNAVVTADSGLLSKLTYTSFIIAMSLASLHDYSWLVAPAILGKHHPVSWIQILGPPFPQHHPHPAWTHWPNRFLGHVWVKYLTLPWKQFKSSPPLHCTLHFGAWFCFSQMLFQFSPFLELTACPKVYTLRFSICLITDYSRSR